MYYFRVPLYQVSQTSTSSIFSNQRKIKKKTTLKIVFNNQKKNPKNYNLSLFSNFFWFFFMESKIQIKCIPIKLKLLYNIVML